MGDMTAVRYDRLTPAARHEIRWGFEGATIAGYVRHYFPDGEWRGDKCGCLDDRCIGYHHDEGDECGCLPSWVRDYWLAEAAPVVWFVDVVCDETCDLEWHRDGKATIGPLAGFDAPRIHGIWNRRGHTATLREERRA